MYSGPALMALTELFGEILKAQEPLAPYTALQVGGRAQFFAEPRSEEELGQLIACCYEEKMPLRVLAAGTNVLIRDEGVAGVVCRLSAPAFQFVTIDGHRVRAGAAVSLTQLIAEVCRHCLAGLESLIGTPGTVGGALFCSLGSPGSTFMNGVDRIEFYDHQGQRCSVSRDDWDALLAEHLPPVVLAVEFMLEADDAESILRRLRRAWISRHGRQPFFFQRTARMFQEPRGLSLEQLFEQAGIRHYRAGNIAVSERDPNFVVVQPGATAREVLLFIEQLRHRVYEHTGHTLRLEPSVW
ncbi:MAG: FAD-binding protein [Gemmatales bacterium]|nr:FAD-binding protein [Gemmatales bacterium]MDW8174927.1 FAD-binding protein [Gemmatales bacterium]